jgi:hypothetical protein
MHANDENIVPLCQKEERYQYREELEVYERKRLKPKGNNVEKLSLLITTKHLE